MKRNAFTVIISILLIIVSIAALAAAGWGGLECYALLAVKGKLDDTLEPVQKLEEAIGKIKEAEPQYIEGLDACDEGDVAIDDGWSKVNEGKEILAQGEVKMAEAQAQYDTAAAQLEAGRARVAEAQAQLDEARPKYEEGKELLAKLENLRPLLKTYVSLRSSVLANVAGFDTLEAWFMANVVPALIKNDLEVPADPAAFAEYMDGQIAQGNAMLAQYEQAESVLISAQGEVDEAQRQLDQAKALLDSKRAELDSGYDMIATAEKQLYNAAAQLDEGKATLGEYETALTQLREGIIKLLETEPITGRDGTVAVRSIAQRLGGDFNINKYNEAGEVLVLDSGEPCPDAEKCLEVCAAYRGFIKDYKDGVAKETLMRIILDSALLAAAVLAFCAAISALRGKEKAVKRSVILFGLLLAANVFGACTGYLQYTYPPGEENYQGTVPVFGLLVLTVMALIFMLTCRSAKKRAKKPEAAPKAKRIKKPVKEPVFAAAVKSAAEPEPVIIPEPVVEPGPVIIPEPVVEPEPVIITEPVVEPEPVAEPEPVIDEDEALSEYERFLKHNRQFFGK